MRLPHQGISDQHILSLFAENNPAGWEVLYDKYAPAMYGIIYNLTKNKTIAEEIFTAAFLQLKEKRFFSDIKNTFCPLLLRYTYNFTIRQLKRFGINPKYSNSPEENKLTYLLYTRCNSLKEAASALNITVEEAKRKLHFEFIDHLNQAAAD